jgi:hypothetical protein
MDLKKIFLKPNRTGSGRGVCAAAGIAIAAGLYYAGYTPAEPTLLTGIAFAAAGAAAGLLIYGVFDIIRKVL